MAEGLTSERGFLLKPLTFVGLGIVIVCAVALAYVGGVMSGRASAEQQLRAEVRAAYVAGMEAEQNKEEQQEGILQPEELEFSRELRNDNRLGNSSPAKPIQSMPAVSPSSQAQATASREKTAGDSAVKDGALKEAVTDQPPLAQAPQVSAPLAAQAPSGLQDFVFQVAALKNEDAADALRQRLEGRGLRTYMKRERKLLLIQVKLRGDTARSKELMDILESMHLGRPILISQKPAVY
ncbi:MAG: SPOR domain-containing protein [Desulfovibrio sp.]|nr:SPOR domain-containing protein [Desulfovibrio sp.]